jgi:hypothetical protein
MYEILLSSLLVFLVLAGGIAIWIGVKLNSSKRPHARSRHRRTARRQAPTDPWSSVQRLPRGRRVAQ